MPYYISLKHIHTFSSLGYYTVTMQHFTGVVKDKGLQVENESKNAKVWVSGKKMLPLYSHTKGE